MLRTVLAVALSLALLAVSLPLIDAARVAHADGTVERSLDRLDRAAASLLDASDPVPAGVSGARRRLTVRVPVETWASAGLDRLSIPAVGSDIPLSWRVDGGDTQSYVPSAPLVGPPGGLTLRDVGQTTLLLRLRRRDGRPVVVVTRPDV